MLGTFRLFFCLVAATSIAQAAPANLGKRRQPRVISNRQTFVAVVFGRAGEILFADSRDGGGTFSAPRTLTRLDGMMLGMRRGPRAAMCGQTIVVTAISAKTAAPDGGNFRLWTSPDRGQTWKQSPRPLNSVAGSAREGLDGLAASPDGVVVAVWLDLRNAAGGKPGTEVWMNRSNDGGLTWEGDRVLYRNPGGTVCECCHPSVAIDDKGNVAVMFRNFKDGARDMYVMSSTDCGKTFGEAQKIGARLWKLNACPMDGGELTIDPDGKMQTVWMRSGEIFTAAAGGDGWGLGSGRQPVIVTTTSGLWRAWTDGHQL